jgi:hypothetical protein
MRTHRSTLVTLAAVATAVIAAIITLWPAAVAGAGSGARSGAGSASSGRQAATRPLGVVAAQVGSRLVLDSLAVPGGPQGGPVSPPPGGVTVAISSLLIPVIAPPSSPTLAATPPTPAVAPVTRVVVPTTLPTTVQSGVPPAGGVWAELRQCESGGDYSIDTGNGYYGAYQFSATTWHGLGYPGLPNQAAPSVQDQAAQRLQARSGWGQWPACSRKLGL